MDRYIHHTACLCIEANHEKYHMGWSKKIHIPGRKRTHWKRDREILRLHEFGLKGDDKMKPKPPQENVFATVSEEDISRNKTASADVLAGLHNYTNMSCFACIRDHSDWTQADAYIRTLRKYSFLVWEGTPPEFRSHFRKDAVRERPCLRCAYRKNII